ncbi:MAG: SH3 domain-containing protein [Cyanobacteria bacterium P01_A01_bin.105]
MKQFAVGLSKLVIGISLALAIIGLAGIATTKYFLTRLTNLPERPVYSNDNPSPQQSSADAFTAPADTPPTASEAEEAPAQPEAEASPAEAALYEATVVQTIGLLVRSGPGPEHGQLGGVDFQDQLTVLEESNGWLRVRSDNNLEGWVKGGGNVQRSN